MKIGILALQGGFEAHAGMLARLNQTPLLVKKQKDMEGIHGLILPGGESSTNIKLMDESLQKEIATFYSKGYPFLATCAGLILLAKNITNSEQFRFGFLDIEVKRNAYGNQRESFSEDIFIESLGKPDFHCVFIRAPKIEKTSEKVAVLAQIKDNIIFVKENNILAASFHPELTQDTRIHQMFLNMCEEKKMYTL